MHERNMKKVVMLLYHSRSLQVELRNAIKPIALQWLQMSHSIGPAKSSILWSGAREKMCMVGQLPRKNNMLRAEFRCILDRHQSLIT